MAQQAPAPQQLPSFAELEAAGARIGEIRVDAQDIFDLTDPREDNWFYRLANRLHINTRPQVVRRALLFKSGEPVSTRLIEETERLLRGNQFLYDVLIQPIAVRDGVVDVEVRTRDTWSLQPSASVSRAGGENTGRISLEEDNLLGTGIAVGVQYKKDVDRRGTQFHASDRNFLGTRSIVDYTYANQDDGAAHALGVTRPFYALDTRWAAGARAGTADSVESLYNAGDQVAEYLRSRSDGEVFGGWSPGLVRGWTRRFSLGAAYEDNDYEPKPGAPAPVRLPQDQTFAGPFVRLELIEDGFRKDTNVNQIGRIEDLNMGVVSRLQVGRALTDFGSTSNAWLYKADVANGFDLTANSFLLTNLGVSGRYASSSENVFLGGSARYYHRHGRRVVYYAAVSADVAHDPDNPGPLLIGGDTGLRGYPLRYQAGERRALLTLEARGYTDWYPLRLFRVGGAVFYDVGRAWGGENQNTQNPGWLHDVGFGLRILNARTAFGSVLHADIAFPLNAEGDIKSVQFVLRTKAAL